MSHFAEFVGVDVGKRELVAHFHRADRTRPFPNDAAGVAHLIGAVRRRGPAAVFFEPTGGYERRLWHALEAEKIHARQMCARRIKRFAEARGQRFKTDAGDARRIAEYAAHFPEDGRRAPRPEITKIAELAARRQALVRDRKVLKTRMHRTEDSVLFRLELERAELLDRHIDAIEKMIAERIAADPELAQREALLRSIPAIGPVLAALLVGRMPELGAISNGEAAALAGLAPFARESGDQRGVRRIQGGRRDLRGVLFQAALVAGRYNPEIAPFVGRLKARGKKHKQVVIAAARKLLLQANAVLKRQTPWTDHPPANAVAA